MTPAEAETMRELARCLWYRVRESHELGRHDCAFDACIHAECADAKEALMDAERVLGPFPKEWRR